MTESQEKPLATWLMENIVKGDGSEISSKLTSILPKKKLGQLVLKLFSNVERKTGRSRGNWQKVTQILWHKMVSDSVIKQFKQ